MKKILVPTDLSSIAELGLQLAVEIAKRCQASISLVNFTRHPLGKTFSAMGEINSKVDEEGNLYTLQLLHATKTRLEQYVLEYAHQGVVIETSILDDELKDGIDDYLSREAIDLIVMGTSGEESGEEIFTGNHTQQVIKVSSCPVLSVREAFRIEDLNNMVVAVDVISDNRVALGLRIVNQIAQCFDAHVHLVHIVQDSSKALILNEYFIKLAQAAELPNFSVHILEANHETERLIMYAREVRAGLVAVLKNSKNGFFNMFANHFSDRVIKEVGRPVFTVNLQNSLSNF